MQQKIKTKNLQGLFREVDIRSLVSEVNHAIHNETL